MGTFRLCENRKAEQPFYHDMIQVHIYSLEELCYYMEKHLYLIDPNWFGEALFSWIGKELDQIELSTLLLVMYQKKTPLFELVLTLFEGSEMYSQDEIRSLERTLNQMKDKTPIEQRKMRGDRLLEEQKYRQAAYTYMTLLQPEYMERMTEELHGDILHNLGVIYAREFLFEDAANMFADSYRLNHRDASRDAYLYAMNYVSEDFEGDESGMDLNFNVMRDALARFEELTEDPDHFVKRREIESAHKAYDWKSSEADLIRKWGQQYFKTNA